MQRERNCDQIFHEAHERAYGKAEGAAPIFVVLADRLVVFHGKVRHERSVSVPAFHAIKRAAHAPVALFAIASLHGGAEPRLDERTKAALASMHDAAAVEAAEMETEAAHDCARAIDGARSYAAQILAEGRVDRKGLATFAAALGPVLLRLTEHATRVQLRSLHAAVEEELSLLDAAACRSLQVVVTGDHQARARSLAMQYFQRRFGEQPGEEKRVSYAEGIEDAEEARALVGKRRFDRAIATAFFGDPTRLQRDVLGDAAASLLGALPLERIPGEPDGGA
jgi:hypothetical protein